jgi:hypothetical protein
MTCQEIRENLGAYLLHKLSNEESASIQQHLCECTSCTTELDNLKQVDIALEHVPSIEPSPSFDATLFAKLDELETRGSKKWFDWRRIRLGDRYAWSLVVLLITAMGLWLEIRHQQYIELNTLQKVIELQERYLGTSMETDNIRSKPSDQVKESATTKISQRQKSTESSVVGDEDIPEEDKVLLENLELLQDYEILNSFEVADHRNAAKERAAN